MKKFDFLKTLPRALKSATVLMLTMLMTVSTLLAQYSGTGTFVKINSLDELTSGYYVVTNQTGEYAMLNQNSNTSTNYILKTDAVFSNPDASIVWYITVAGDGTISLYNEAAELYPSYAGSGNSAILVSTLADNARWTPSIDVDGNWVLTNVAYNTRNLSYNASSPRFACYGNTSQQELSFYKLQEAGTLAAPVFSVAGGFKYEAVTLSMTAPAGASIYYTLDGTTPTSASTLYSTPLNISTTTTVKAIAVLGDEESSVAEATYSFPVVTTTADFRLNGTSNVVYDIPNCTFVFKSGRYVFVKDATGGLCIYDYNTPVLADYQEGDVIPHVYGTRTVYNGMVELVPTHGTDAAIINVGHLNPITVTADNILNNYDTYEGQLVKIVGITFTGNRQFVPATRNSVTFSQNGSDNLYIYNAFSNLSANVVTGQTADVIGFVAAYNAQKQLFPRNNADIILHEVALPYAENFDGESNQWNFDQSSQANEWYVGQPTGFQTGALYVSDNGNSNKYDIATTSVSHVYMDVMVPAEGAILSFDYRVGGEGTYTLYDFFAVSMIDPNDDLVVGQQLSDNIVKYNLSDGWQHASVALAGESTQTVKRLVFTWVNDNSGGTQPAAAIDNITIVAGSCMPPADLAVSNIEAESATIAWAADTNVTWQVEYKTAEETDWTTVSALANTVNMTNLTSNTEYMVRVKRVCDANTSSDYANTTFTTLSICGAPENVTVTPTAFDADVEWTVAPHTTYDVEIKEASSTEWVTIMTGVNAVPVNIGGLAVSTNYNLRVVAHCSVDNGTATSNVVNFATTVECPAPVNLTGTPNGNQIDVTWTSNDYFGHWILQYRMAGTDLWSSEIDLNQPSYTITPVQTATSYEIRVKSFCNHNTLESDYSVINVMVPCSTGGSQTNLTVGTGTSESYYSPYNNYYGNSWNECIYLASEIGTSGVIDAISYNVSSATAYTCDQIKIYMGHTTKDIHASTSDWTPLSDLTLVYTANNITIGSSTGWETRQLTNPFNYNGEDNLVIVVTHAAGSDYTGSLKYYYTSKSNRCLYRQADGNASYAEHPGTNTGTRSTYVPNIKLSITPCGDLPICAVPENVTASNVTETSAVVNWTGNAAHYIIKVSTPNAADEIITGISGNSYTLTGLNPNETHYTVMVASQCEENTYSTYSTSASFTTGCVAMTIPYTQNFDGYAGSTASTVVSHVMPPCWSYHNAGTSYPGYPQTYNSSSYAASGVNSLRFYMYTSSGYADQYAIMPVTDVPVNQLMVNFDLRGYNTGTSYCAELEVGVMTDPTDPSTFVSLGSHYETGATTYNNYTIYLNNYTGNGQYIAFKAPKPSTGYNAFTVDNILVDYAPSCSAPTITNYNITSKLLTWTNGDMGTPQSYQVICNANGTTTNTFTFTTTEGLLMGLAGLTDYTVYVRTICGEGDTSEWSAPYTFTTPETGCTDPANLVAVVNANQDVTLTWDADPEQNTWAVYSKFSDSPVWSAPVMVTGTPTVTLSGLQTATTYDFRVSAICNNGTTESGFTYASAYIPCSTASGDPEVIVGTGTSTTYTAPFNNFYKNSRNEVIYLASEIGQAGPITSIAYNVSNAANWTASTINIYLAHTSRTTFASTTDWTPANDLTLVYSSTNQTIGSSTGWLTFDLETPFMYNGTDNLVVVVTKTCSSYNSSLKFYYTSLSNRCLYRQSDSNTAYADITNVSQSGTKTTYVPNIKFNILPPCNDPVLCEAEVTGVTTSNVTETSLTVNWTATGADSYVLEYGEEGFAVGAGTQITTTATSATINGLADATSYSFVVYPICANGNVGTPNEIVVTTGGTVVEPDVFVMGQDFNVTTCDAYIYDDGGPTGNYLTYSDETLVVTPSTPGAGLHITGTYDMEDGYDYVSIYDANNNLLAELTDYGTVDITTQGAITIVLESDGSVCYSGFAFHVECVGGEEPPVVETDVYVMGEDVNVTTCDAIIYDNGGATGNYETYSDETMVINPGVAGASLHFTGTYNMETNWDYIYIYDANNTQLYELTGSGEVDFTVNGPVTIHLESDGSVCYSGFAFNVACVIPQTINTELNGISGIADACDLSGQHITAFVTNTGIDHITSLTGTYSVNGGAVVTETFYVQLPADQGTSVTFTTPVVFTQTTGNEIEVSVYASNEPSTLWNDNTVSLTGINEIAPMTAPYPVLPVSGSQVGSDGWNVIDVYGNGVNWTISGTTMNAPHSDFVNLNNWIITPCYDLTAGMYKVTYDYKVNNSAIPESFAVYYGQGGQVADMTNLLAQYTNASNDTYLTATHYINIPADGTYNFGFLANSEAGGLGMSVKALTVKKMVTMTALANGNGTITPSGQIMATEGENVTFVMNPDANYYLQNVTLNGQIVATYGNVAQGVIYHHTVAANDVLIANFTRANLFNYVVDGGQGYVNGDFYTAPASWSETYANGEDIYITFVPDAGYHVENVNINGVDYGPITDWVITNVAHDYTFIITFAPNTYVVTTTAYGNGTVTPGATFVYDPANTYNFVATPAANAHIASILRNNEELTIVDPFSAYTETLTNILSDYNYVVRFDPNNYTVTATAGAHGTITPAGESNYVYTTDAVYAINAANGYYIASVTVDGVTTDYTQANALTSMTYTFAHISANHTISATFAQYEYTITVNAGENGTINPGTTTVGENATPTFNIVPNAGYGIADVTVDGVSVGAVTSYTFAPVSANHTIAATFAQYQYTITATAGNGGVITPNGVTNMVYNGNQTYTITPSAGYHIADVYVDGASVGAVTSYTFTGVTANHTIYAAFDINEYTVTVTQPAHGDITPGTITVQYGATPSFVITPNIGYNVTAITLNGTNVIGNTPQVNGVYTLTLPAVTANATLTATMTAKTYTITASAGANGTITPSGVATVNFGDNKSYSFTPANGYEVANVMVDGMSMGAISSYTFVNVVANHTINVTFKLQECELPTNMQTIFVDTTSATLYWYHAGAVSYDIQYKAVTDATFTTTNTTQTTYTLTGLTPSTTYIWMVRANCVANNPSDWTNGTMFRTLDVFQNPDGIEEHIKDMINVYSETNNVYIVNENGIRIDNVQIYDVYGKLLYTGSVNGTSEVISMNVATGTYLVRLATEYGTCNYKLHLTK
ncbi:MAG: fibronectin type III domain-containing protein [Bacteroidales bacterium]|nr:fibronectin type III domain-containing protein [Bacteroidales bacterium]